MKFRPKTLLFLIKPGRNTKMKSKKSDKKQRSFLLPTLAEQCDPRQSLKQLADKLPWGIYEEAFSELYSEVGRPAKPIRLMVGLLLLKQIENLSDETLIERWVQNPYYQYFCGMEEFQWSLPCDPSDLVYFRKRIGEGGVSLIFSTSVELHEKSLKEREIVVDTTVQEKNITYPTDAKLRRKIVQKCWAIADRNQIKLRRRYKAELKELVLDQRFRRNKGTEQKADAALRRMKTIAGKLIRELQRKLKPADLCFYEKTFEMFTDVLNQKRSDKNKIYSLHEPHVYCISKGKEQKKYEYGCKVSIAMTKDSGVIVGALSHPDNIYDGHTLDEVMEMVSAVLDQPPSHLIVDRGYRGRKWVEEAEVCVPNRSNQTQTKHHKAQARKRFRRRAAIEPVIGHLKHDFRMARNYLKGKLGDQINVMMAACAWNMKKWMRESLFAWIRGGMSDFQLTINCFLKLILSFSERLCKI